MAVCTEFMAMFYIYLVSVNSQGIVGGNDENPHEICQACHRGGCKSINGIYTLSELPAGYSLVTQIPEGACGVHVQQLKHTRNFLAVQFKNGSYIFNGDWKFSPSRSFDVAGTRFTYIRQDGSSLETISASGPLATPINIMIIANQVNPGIKYGYSIPIDNLPVIAPPLIKRTQSTFHQSSPSPSTSQAEAGNPTKRFDIYSNISFINANQKDDPWQSTLTTTISPPTTTTSTTSVHRRTRLRRKYFHWKITGLTQCSKSCGRGTQTYIRTCYRSINGHNKVPVNEKRCAHLDAPAFTPIPCNTEPCETTEQLTVWGGFWSQCSVSCGEGIQNFIPQCKQDLNGVSVVISDAQCPQPKPTLQTRVCQEHECVLPKTIADNELPYQNSVPNIGNNRKKEWTVSEWSQCSVTCGSGHRSRSVTCPSGQCHAEDRPVHAEYCMVQSCDTTTTSPTNNYNSAATPLTQFKYPKATANNSKQLSSTKNSFASWFVTEWSQCSEQCGTGNQTRFVLCEFDNCNVQTRPETTRACSSEQHCDAQWFAGPWGECSDSCSGVAKQKREILCIARIRGVPHVTNDMVCPIAQKPHAEQACNGNCPPKWFTNDWSGCESNQCPLGIQKRDVKCLEINKNPSNSCTEVDRPTAKRSCTCAVETNSRNRNENNNNNRDKFTFKLAQDEPIDRSCVDRITKCRLAVQARLCYYPYYTTNCCKSCSQSNVQQEYYE